MTSSLKITAHCSSNKQVVVEIQNTYSGTETMFLQDGETVEKSIYDDRILSVKEVLKDDCLL